MNGEWKYFSSLDEAALRQWVQSWHAGHAQGGVLAFVAEQDKDFVTTLQRVARENAVPLAGAMFPELVVQDRFHKQGVLLCGLDPMPAYRLAGGLGTEQQRRAAVEAVQQMVQEQGNEGTLMLIFDGMYGQIASMLDDLFYAVGSACKYAGVNAGSETFKPMPCLFDGEHWIGDGVLALALPGEAGAELEHGYVVPEESLSASAATGNRVVQIDWRPAFEVYAELIRKHYGQEVTRENFYSMGVHFPFALMLADGQVLIRIPVAVDDEGALFCVGEVPDGALLSVAKAAEPGNMHTVDTLLGKYASHPSASSLFFYCAGRRMHMGEAAGAELQRFAQAQHGRPVMGALSLGEIGNSPAGGYPLFHNATLVVLPIGNCG